MQVFVDLTASPMSYLRVQSVVPPGSSIAQTENTDNTDNKDVRKLIRVNPFDLVIR